MAEDTAVVAEPAAWYLNPAYAEGAAWLTHEANLLDRGRFDEWLALLSPTLRYVMPARATVLTHDGDGFSTANAHFDETFESLRVRVKRLDTATQWAENPRSRTRRFVANVELVDADATGVRLRSALLVLRSRFDSPAFELLSAEREDRLVREDRLRLAERTIRIDQETIGTANVSIFL